MKKIVSLVLTVAMIFSAFAIPPATAGAAETYKAETEVKVTFTMPETQHFTGIDAVVTYADSLQLVSFEMPNVADAVKNTGEKGKIYFNSSSAATAYDLSADGVLCTLKFIVLEDMENINVNLEIFEIYLRNNKELVDVSKAVEMTTEVISAPTEEPTPSYTLGDVNNDGKINIMDVAFMQMYAASLTSLSDTAVLAADVTGDGKVNIMDVAYVQMYIANLMDSFPASK